jgi:hypothetical protein
VVETVVYAVGLPTAIMGTVLVLTILLAPLRRRAVLADCALAVCLPGAALLSFVLEKGLIVPGGDGWQKWFITAWVLLGAMALGLIGASLGRGRKRGLMTVVLAGAAGAAAALWIVLPGLDNEGLRVTMGLKFTLPVLAFAAASMLRRDVVFHIGVWATAAAVSMTLMASANITLALTAGALAACAAVAAIALSIFPSAAPSNRVGLGAAVGVSITLVIMVLVGQIYDIEGVAPWRWWLPLAGVPALLLLPKPASSTAKATNGRPGGLSGNLLAIIIVVAPSVASIVLAINALTATNPSGY